jgi:hypothetical protein
MVSSKKLVSLIMSLALMLINKMVQLKENTVILLKLALLCLQMLLCLSSFGMKLFSLPLFS